MFVVLNFYIFYIFLFSNYLLLESEVITVKYQTEVFLYWSTER